MALLLLLFFEHLVILKSLLEVFAFLSGLFEVMLHLLELEHLVGEHFIVLLFGLKNLVVAVHHLTLQLLLVYYFLPLQDVLHLVKTHYYGVELELIGVVYVIFQALLLIGQHVTALDKEFFTVFSRTCKVRMGSDWAIIVAQVHRCDFLVVVSR